MTPPRSTSADRRGLFRSFRRKVLSRSVDFQCAPSVAPAPRSGRLPWRPRCCAPSPLPWPPPVAAAVLCTIALPWPPPVAAAVLCTVSLPWPSPALKSAISNFQSALPGRPRPPTPIPDPDPRSPTAENPGTRVPGSCPRSSAADRAWTAGPTDATIPVAAAPRLRRALFEPEPQSRRQPSRGGRGGVRRLLPAPAPRGDR